MKELLGEERESITSLSAMFAAKKARLSNRKNPNKQPHFFAIISMKLDFFNYRFMFVPLSIVLMNDDKRQWRNVYVFGVRLIYWTVS